MLASDLCALRIYVSMAYITIMAHVLDNPLWSSLTSMHASLAIGGEGALRYPADVVPFVAVERDGLPLREGLIEPGETWFAVGPRSANAGVEDLGEILQMVCAVPPPVPEGPLIASLDGSVDRGAVLELAALVYPHYFRPRTPALGRYWGIRLQGTLAAMVGERMGMPGYREISAVCTHPDFVGRGLARRLLLYAANEIAREGAIPFLHVSPTNDRAVKLYQQNGFVVRRGLPFAKISIG